MAVSLEKRIKVDLSKPELPQKMREYTTIHLMDEEETIKEPVTEIVSHQSSESVRQVDDEAIPNHTHSESGNKLTIAFYIFGPLVLCAGSFFILRFVLPNMLDFIGVTDGIEADVVLIFRSLSTNPLIILGLIFSCVGATVRGIRKSLDVGKL